MPNRNTESKPTKKPAPDRPTGDNEASKQQLDGAEAGDKKKWDIIDEHAWESFPASDPPASWAGKDIAPQDREDAAANKNKKS